jgi:SAM-dependent methyltransferase
VRERLPGVTVHEGDMTSFDLGRTFDAVTCLFSAIGHARTLEGLQSAVETMARHLEPGGVLAIEPWFWPEQWIARRPHVMTIDEPEFKLVRMNTTWVEGRLAVMDMHHLVGRPEAVEHFVERIELALYTHEEYLEAFRAAGLPAEHDPEGLMGRGLYLGTRVTS